MKLKLNYVSCLLFYLLILPSYLSAYEFSANPLISVTEEYNDNLYLDKDNKIDDFITVISPGLKSELRWQKAGIKTEYNLGYSIYDKNAVNDNFRHHGDIASWWDVSRNTHFHLSDSYDRSEDVSSLPIENTARIARSVYYLNSTHLGLDNAFGENKNITLGYEHRILNNVDNSSLDNKSDVINGNLIYYPDPFWGTETNVTLTNGYYNSSQDFQQWVGSTRLVKLFSRNFQINGTYSHSIMKYSEKGTNNNYQIYNPSIGFRYDFDEGETFSIDAGYFVQDIDNRTNEKGLSMDGNIGKTWRFKQGSMNIKGNSGYGNSQLGVNNLGFNVFYGSETRFEYQFSRTFSSSINATYKHSDYINSASIPGGNDQVDKYVTAGVAFKWQLNQWIESSMEYAYKKLNSNMNINNYTDNRILFTLTLFSHNRNVDENSL
jgi:hypothetical protein